MNVCDEVFVFFLGLKEIKRVDKNGRREKDC